MIVLIIIIILYNVFSLFLSSFTRLARDTRPYIGNNNNFIIKKKKKTISFKLVAASILLRKKNLLSHRAHHTLSQIFFLALVYERHLYEDETHLNEWYFCLESSLLFLCKDEVSENPSSGRDSSFFLTLSILYI